MRSLIIRAGIRGTDVYRHIGVDEQLSLGELHEVLDVCFGFEGGPWSFPDFDSADPIPDTCSYRWGLWEVDLQVIDIYPRDRGTPRALCIGGSGALGDATFDLAAINRDLTGRATIEEVLSLTKPQLRAMIERAELFDFVPLLQALDLTQARHHLDLPLPLERDPAGRDAFWSLVLVLSCFAEPDVTDNLLETTMATLGWVEDDGTPLRAPAIRALCAESLQQLARVGAYGRHAKSPVERLDIYRELLAG
ncbi:hypothetical protein [Corynebacterium epidermidicanis]|uniref:Uncharacterized protein n=1 Tax=Corynebacterium epidermidicanis TaxID=1050174 RepID=A0A0G3GLI2_9CORY|nr:hypothetical protein [Corynebacterium epidermidicanis]AKK02096.1 hypothetical protein CEPID_01010 [Corynebacterium epidermidicanis]